VCVGVSVHAYVHMCGMRVYVYGVSV